MIYYHYDMLNKISKKANETLQKYFEGNEWGASVSFYNGDIDCVEICKVKFTGYGSEQRWTHYANIVKLDEKKWEVNEQFMGDDEMDMHVYAVLKSFGAAVRNLAIYGNSENKRKVLEVI